MTVAENRFDLLADYIYEEYKNTRDFETTVVKFLHVIAKILVFYLAD